MKNILISFLICFATMNCCAQSVKTIVTGGDTTYLIRAKHYQGVIFPASYTTNIDQKNRFTPVKGEINAAENELSKLWDKVNLHSRGTDTHDILDAVTPYFSNYKRQYYGYINNQGQKIVYIHLLNFFDKSAAAQYFIGWGNRYMTGDDEFYHSNTAGFEYNLETKVMVAEN
jgi:hypothetical protein